MRSTRQVIYDCHREAVDYVLTYAEREVFHSRSGTNGIVTEDIDGVIAAASPTSTRGRATLSCTIT